MLKNKNKTGNNFLWLSVGKEQCMSLYCWHGSLATLVDQPGPRASSGSMGSGQPFQVYLEALHLTALLLGLIILQQLESVPPSQAWVPSHMPVLVWTLFILLRVEEETLLAFFSMKLPRYSPFSLPLSQNQSGYQSFLHMSSCSMYITMHNKADLVLISNSFAIFTGCWMKGPSQYLLYVDTWIVCPWPHYQNSTVGKFK